MFITIMSKRECSSCVVCHVIENSTYSRVVSNTPSTFRYIYVAQRISQHITAQHSGFAASDLRTTTHKKTDDQDIYYCCKSLVGLKTRGIHPSRRSAAYRHNTVLVRTKPNEHSSRNPTPHATQIDRLTTNIYTRTSV